MGNARKSRAVNPLTKDLLITSVSSQFVADKSDRETYSDVESCVAIILIFMSALMGLFCRFNRPYFQNSCRFRWYNGPRPIN